MFKTAMLVSALAISAPALAQDMPAPQTPPMPQAQPAPMPQPATPPTQADPATTPETPVADDPATAPADEVAAPVSQDIPGQPTTAPAEQAATPTTAPAAPATAPAETAAAPADPNAPVTGATQIAQVVNTEFPTYDKNADSNLDKNEFSAWMVALKTASDPATKAGDPATVKWVDGAFASADADKSAAVSKEELTKYLSQGAEE